MPACFIALTLATAVGTVGLRMYPVRADEVFLAVVEARRPDVFHVLACGYALLWFSTPFFIASLMTSLFAIVVYRNAPPVRFRALPRTLRRRRGSTPSLVLGEAHHPTRTGRAPEPAWLTIPQRGLYTGVMILGAVGTGKTSACMYPYVDQLLRWRSGRRRPEGGRTGDGGEGRLLPPGAGHPDERLDAATTTSRSGSTPASATTRCTTTSIRMRWPTRLPRC